MISLQTKRELRHREAGDEMAALAYQLKVSSQFLAQKETATGHWSFTLGAHVQRGLQYSVCVCVCVCVYLLPC